MEHYPQASWCIYISHPGSAIQCITAIWGPGLKPNSLAYSILWAPKFSINICGKSWVLFKESLKSCRPPGNNQYLNHSNISLHNLKLIVLIKRCKRCGISQSHKHQLFFRVDEMFTPFTSDRCRNQKALTHSAPFSKLHSIEELKKFFLLSRKLKYLPQYYDSLYKKDFQNVIIRTCPRKETLLKKICQKFAL